MINISPEEAEAVVKVLRRSLDTETDYRVKRDAGDALVEIERQISSPSEGRSTRRRLQGIRL